MAALVGAGTGFGGEAGAEGPAAEITGAPTLTFKHRPKFEFQSANADATFKCAVDRRGFRPCSSPFRPDRLKLGRHSFAVRAIDPVDGAGPPTSEHVFRVADTRWKSVPPKRSADRTPRFRFHLKARGAEDASFECRLDGSKYRECSSPHASRRLKFGRHVFKVRAVTPEAGTDPTPAKRAFRVIGFRKPSIKKDPIPYSSKRRNQMAAYSKRHYGKATWRLNNPRQIVLHYTVSSTYSPVWNTFASNSPALGESPGVCAQYVVDKDGTIYNLVAPDVRCRHAVGLNHRSIGIEIVQEGGGSPERAILNRRPQRVAAQKLAGWLTERYEIRIKDVIGHAMANNSRFFRDRSGWRNDHSDWRSLHVREFRAGMRKLRR